MARMSVRLCLVALVLLSLPLQALGIVEPDTETEYPDTITLEVGDKSHELIVTGVGVREKTFLKVDVYTIASYIDGSVDLGADPARTLRTVDAPKRIRMDLRRGFSREKLVKAFTEVIAKNYDDTGAFAVDLESFTGYFTRDAEENDVLLFTYVPGVGLTTSLNGENLGVIANFAFTEALWTVWFGDKPADGNLKKSLVGQS